MPNQNTSLTGSELWKRTAVALDRGDFTALEEMLEDSNVSVIDLLIANGEPPKYMAEALSWACFVGLTDVARELLDRGVDPADGFATGMAAFHWAANRGNLDTVKLLIDRGAPLEQKNMYGGSILNCTLWSAVHEHNASHAEIIDALVKAGAVVEDDALEWWNEQPVPSSETKDKVARTLRGIQK
jgi:hypothetical protein